MGKKFKKAYLYSALESMRGKCTLISEVVNEYVLWREGQFDDVHQKLLKNVHDLI